MPKLTSFVPLLALVPLAACFDAEMTLSFPDENTAEGTMVMIASQEFYDMSSSSGEPFCEGGTEAVLDDGSHSCTETFSGTIDEALNNPDLGEGMSIERRDGGLLFVSFDLGEITGDLPGPEEAGGEEMMAMMAASFEGHAITMNIAGAEILETNGSISQDGATASFAIPLDKMMLGEVDLPGSFDVLLRPGG